MDLLAKVDIPARQAFLQEMVKTRDELRNFITDFLRDSTNQVRDVARLDRAVQHPLHSILPHDFLNGLGHLHSRQPFLPLLALVELAELVLRLLEPPF